MVYTLGQAAKETGKSKTTIKRAIDKGRLSAKKNDNGEWEIDPAELHRVYPIGEHEAVTKSDEVTQAELKAARGEIRLLEKHLEREREISKGIEKDRDHWRQQATALLTDQRGGNGGGFWSRLFGR